jgi:hypothetical protein
MIKDKPWRKNLPTAKAMVIADAQNFEKEQLRLKEQLVEFNTRSKQESFGNPHPIFGKLSNEKWGQLLFVHLNHHLGQFGV